MLPTSSNQLYQQSAGTIKPQVSDFHVMIFVDDDFVGGQFCMHGVLLMQELKQFSDLSPNVNDQVGSQLSSSRQNRCERFAGNEFVCQKDVVVSDACAIEPDQIGMPQFLKDTDLQVDLVDGFIPINRWRNGNELQGNLFFLFDLPCLKDPLSTVVTESFDDQERANSGIFHRNDS